MSKYGHEGELVEDEFEKRGEVRQTIRCERCNCMVPRDNPEKLKEMDCDQYKELRDAF